MRKLSALLVGVILAASLLISAAPAHADASLNGWHKGILVQATYNTDFSSSNFQQSMRNAAADGVNYVTLVVSVHQDNVYSANVYADGSTITDSSLADGIRYINSLGMHASVSLHDDPYDGQWRAYINPNDRNTWFYTYGQLLNHYADIAQANGASELVIATEMSDMTNPGVNSTNTGNWVTLIKNARAHFSGLMTYSAEHGGYMEDDRELGFWPQLDEIGISAYYGMGGNSPSVSSMQNTWSVIDNGELKQLASTYGKPVIFTEVGYVSGTNALNDPGSAYGNPGSPDTTDQANAYQALLSYWSTSSYFKGASFWDWSTNPNAGGNNDTNYTPQNKSAEQVMKQWFTGGGTGPSTPTAPAAPSTYSLTGSSASVTTGSSVTTTITAKGTQTINNLIVDLEIYDASGRQIQQKYYENQTLTSNGSQYQITWTPPHDGTYSVQAGVFTANWQSNLAYNSSVTSVTSSTTASQQPTPPPATTPTSPPTTTSPTPPAQPTSSSTVDIWWPSNGSAVTGVQPFKALIDGVDQNSYTMYWQVDGGQLNAMANNNTDGTHKEADVDLSSWNWHGNGGAYVINFVAKDASGNIIAQKSTTITINH